MANKDVVNAWKHGEVASEKNLSTNGYSLYSYQMEIRRTIRSQKVALNVSGKNWYSSTTSKHVGLAKRVADRVVEPVDGFHFADEIEEIVESEAETEDSPHSPEETASYPVRQLALAWFLEVDPDDIKPVRYDDNTFYLGSSSYLVATDDEADTYARQYAESYLDELLEEVPESLRSYIDEDKYIDDAISADGRGHLLSSYDGSEEEIDLDCESFREWLYLTFGIPQTVEAESIEFEDGSYGDDSEFLIYNQ